VWLDVARATGAAVSDPGSGFDHHRGAVPLLRPAGLERTALTVTVSLAAFAVVNSLWHYLGTGQWVDLSGGAFRDDLSGPLGQSFLQPLSVFSYPWMILVDGLLLGAIVFVPLTVAVLYRLIVAAVFVLVVALVGHAPVLAIMLAAGCLLATRTRWRSDKPFLAALLAMAPVAVYLGVFSSWGLDIGLAPVQRVVLLAPVAAALVAAVAAVALYR